MAIDTLEKLQKIEFKNRLPIFFSAIDLRPYARELISSSPQEAKPRDWEAMLRALLAAPLEEIDTFTALHDRLDRDLRFRYQCGFDIRKLPRQFQPLAVFLKPLLARD